MPSVQNVLGQNTDTWKLYSQATRLMMRDNGIYLPDCYNLIILAQSVEPLDCRAGGRGLDSWGWTNSNSGSYSATLLTVTTRRMFLIKF